MDMLKEKTYVVLCVLCFVSRIQILLDNSFVVTKA
jgi:hypothetical protein